MLILSLPLLHIQHLQRMEPHRVVSVLLSFCMLVSSGLHARAQTSSGKVFLLGGATDDSSSSIYNALREATGKSNPTIAVAVSAAPSLQDGLEAYIISEPDSLSYY